MELLVIISATPVLGDSSPRNGHSTVFQMNQKLPREIPYCFIPDDNARFDCYPRSTEATREKCESRGCCWTAPFDDAKEEQEWLMSERFRQTPVTVPACFFPLNYQGYAIADSEETEYGFHGTLFRTTHSGWPNDVMTLAFNVFMETESRLHFQVNYRSLWESWANTNVTTNKTVPLAS